ncbi:8491_t:CDS:2, partial [Gigaspora rosea]
DLESVHRKIVLLVESQAREVCATISSQQPANENNTNLQPFLQSLIQLYQFWTLHQQATIYAELEELIQIPPAIIENPVINRPRGRPVGAKNQNQRSVRRDPSAFEIAEKRPKSIVHTIKLVIIAEHVPMNESANML